MTKKFIVTVDHIEKSKVKQEFLIPDIYDNNIRLIGIESGREYSTGLVVFTGVDLNAQIVIEKAIAFKKIGLLKKWKVNKVLSKYLFQIKTLKIGDQVRFDQDGNLQKLIKN